MQSRLIIIHDSGADCKGFFAFFRDFGDFLFSLVPKKILGTICILYTKEKETLSKATTS